MHVVLLISFLSITAIGNSFCVNTSFARIVVFCGVTISLQRIVFYTLPILRMYFLIRVLDRVDKFIGGINVCVYNFGRLLKERAYLVLDKRKNLQKTYAEI